MQNLKLGQKVTFNKILKRYYKRRGGIVRDKYWKEIDVDKQNGILIGIRTLSNGTVEYDYEEGYTYKLKETVKAVIIATTLRSKFLKIPFDNIKETK
jgi:hypothetical protein